MMTALEEFVGLINLLAEEMENGDEIIWEDRVKEARWRWINTRTMQERFVFSNQVKWMPRWDKRDIRFETVMDFIQGRKNALEAQAFIQKLPKLKAFL